MIEPDLGQVGSLLRETVERPRDQRRWANADFLASIESFGGQGFQVGCLEYRSACFAELELKIVTSWVFGR